MFIPDSQTENLVLVLKLLCSLSSQKGTKDDAASINVIEVSSGTP